MSEPAEPAAPPPRTWRPMAAWTGAILLALGLAWFVGAVVVPVWQTDRALAAFDADMERHKHGLFEVTPVVVERLGGPERAARKLNIYLAMPAPVARHKDSAILSLRFCESHAVPVLRRVLWSGSDEGLRSGATLSISCLAAQDASLLPDVLEASADRSPAVRIASIYALTGLAMSLAQDGRPPDPRITKALIALLGDPDDGIRAAAAQRMWEPESLAHAALPWLERLLDDPNSDVRESAAKSIGCIGPAARASIPGLERGLADKSEQVRAATAWALKRIRSEGAGK